MSCDRTLLLAGGPGPLVDELRRLQPDWLVLDAIEDPRLVDRSPFDRSGKPAGPVYAFIPWLLPRMAGIEACRRLRTLSGTGELHITMVLDRNAHDVRMRAIDAGADDYMPAPLTARAVIERVAGGPAAALLPEIGDDADPDILRQGDLLVDPHAFHVRHKNEVVPLSRSEFAMLVYFMERPNRVISREALAAQTGKGGMIQARTIDRSVARLRKTLESHAIDAPIRTVYGMGYVFDAID